MFWRRKRHDNILKGCDYSLAARMLTRQFAGGVIKKELAALLDAFLERPCYETASSIIDYDMKFAVFFNESRPGGFFERMSMDT